MADTVAVVQNGVEELKVRAADGCLGLTKLGLADCRDHVSARVREAKSDLYLGHGCRRQSIIPLLGVTAPPAEKPLPAYPSSLKAVATEQRVKRRLCQGEYYLSLLDG
ncbi:MAG TPA: hypothetical protein PLA18_09245 [Deltaproteobacteria bacterium]|jgi:hypothetical protein|nr:hypothetical protein [Deltaproteobacteria bacterium]